jgi:3-carboxy-cis,cis-muconate cycloisomerase
MPIRLIESLATTSRLSDLFADHAVLEAMLAFEAALALAEARTGIIPTSGAEAIAAAAKPESFHAGDLARKSLRAGTLSIPLVKALTELARAQAPEAAGYVHWGATSQDVSDTAMALLLAKARAILAEDHARIMAALRRLSNEHAATVELGRTLLQAAPPVTFGLKAAGWFAALQRSWATLDAAFESARVLQFGGATGTLAALGTHGPAVAAALASELNLTNPPAPWHTHRDRFAQVITACGIYAGTLGKMARDISLLMQTELAEAFEPGGDGRGGSSTMPHKRNPTACAVALACANRIPGEVANFLHGMIQEQERAVGGWQAEWATIANVIQSTGLALESMVEVAEGLTVNAANMGAHIDATHGVIFAERAMMLLAAKLGRDKAHHLLEEIVKHAAKHHVKLSDAIRDTPEAANALTPEELASLESPEQYLGSAEWFRQRLLEP